MLHQVNLECTCIYNNICCTYCLTISNGYSLHCLGDQFHFVQSKTHHQSSGELALGYCRSDTLGGDLLGKVIGVKYEPRVERVDQ